MRIIFFDTETTGNTDEDRLCQLGAKERNIPEPIINELYKPPLPISIGAMAVHHITEKMIADKPPFKEAEKYKTMKDIFEDPGTVSVAHNATFDIEMLAREDISPRNVVCTYKVAHALDKKGEIEQYKLQYLRYLLDIEVDADAHDAWGDVLVLEGLFERLVKKITETTGGEESAIKEMIKISSQPILFSTIRFGKYAGKQISEIARIDKGYLEWLLTQKKQNPSREKDWIHTLEYYLSGI